MKEKLILLALLLAVCPFSAGAQVSARFDKPTGTWTLANSLFASQFHLGEDGRFQIVLLQSGGRRWVHDGQPASSPIQLSIDGVDVNESTAWTLVSTRVQSLDREGRGHVIVLRNDDLKAEITLRLDAYPGQPFLHTAVAFRNLGTETRFLTRVQFLGVALETAGRPIRSFHVEQMVQGTPRFFGTQELALANQADRTVTVYSGAHADDCTWLALRDSANFGIVFGWEFDGRAHVNAQLDDSGRYVTVWGLPDNLHLPVAAGQLANLPGAFIGFFKGDWDEAGYRTQRFAEAVLAPPLPDDRFPWVAFDSWFYGTAIDENTMRKAAEVSASIGVELFILDLGWAKQIGQWTPDPKKFPSGLRAFSDYVHNLGMKFGLHFVPTQAMQQAPVLLTNPDWTATAGAGYYDSVSICLGNTPTQQWSRQQLRNMIERYNVDWVTQDSDDLVKDCTKTSHTHDPENSNWANSENGIDALVSRMRTEFPAVSWENNSCGGDMQTFRAVKNYATMGSCDACDSFRRRQAVYGMSYVFSPRYIDRYVPDGVAKYDSRSSMFGGPWIFMQRLSDWGSTQINAARQEVELYKSLRGLIRDGKVFHLLPPDGVHIDAIESYNSAQDSAVIFVYRPANSAVTSQKIMPRGLNANAVYTVRFQESRQGAYPATGAQLMAEGIQVPTPSANFAEIVYISGNPPATQTAPELEQEIQRVRALNQQAVQF